MPAKHQPAAAKQFSVPLYDRPGALSQLTEVLFKEGVNLLGITSDTSGTVAFVHFIVDKEPQALKALRNAGFQVYEAPLFFAELPNRPGELNRLCKALAQQGLNIRSVYGTTGGGELGRLAFTVDNAEKAAPVFEKWMARETAPAGR